MNKAAAVASAAVVSVAAAATGAFAWAGSTAVGALQEQSAHFAKLSPSFQLVDEKVERGLFRSSHEMKLRIGCMPSLPTVPGAPALPVNAGEPIEFGVRTEVRHGPLLPSGTGFAQFDSVLVVPDAWRERVDELTHRQPLRVVSSVGFDRSFESEFTVPGVKFSDPEAGSFETQTLRGQLKGSSLDPSQGATYLLDIPGFALHSRAPDATLDMELGRVQSETKLAPRTDSALWFASSQARGSLAELTVIASAASSLGGAPNAFKMSFPSLAFSADSKLEQGLYTSTVSYAGEGRFNEFKVDKVEFKGGVRRLDAAVYQDLLKQLLESVFSCDPKLREQGLEAQFPVLERNAVKMMMRDPEYGVDLLAVQIAGQRGELSYSVGTQGVKAPDAQRALLELALEHGVINAHVKVQLGLLDAIDKQLAAGGQPGQLRALADFALAQFGEAGYVVQNGDALESTLSYRGGQLLLNGKTPALPDMGNLLGGP